MLHLQLKGLVLSPKKRKKIAENKSLKGASLIRATIATSPVKSSPTRKAATAPEKPKYVAIPDARSADPNTVRRSVAESPKICGPWGI